MHLKRLQREWLLLTGLRNNSLRLLINYQYENIDGFDVFL